jgi:hypothetical protein
VEIYFSSFINYGVEVYNLVFYELFEVNVGFIKGYFEVYLYQSFFSLFFFLINILEFTLNNKIVPP